MPKHTAEIADTVAPLAAEIARILDLEGTRVFDGHFVVAADEFGKVSGAILHAHDKATVLTFDLTLTVS